MRIGIDATAAVRQYAGVGRFARGLLGGLAQVDAHNHYVLLTTGKPRIAVDAAGLPPQRSWMRLPVSDRLATIAWHRLRAPLPPTAFLGGVSLFFTPDFALPPLGKTPGVVTVHDLSFLLHPECADEGLRR